MEDERSGNKGFCSVWDIIVYYIEDWDFFC